MANPKLPPGQLAEERVKRKAGGSHKTDCARRKHADPLFGLAPLMKKQFPKWLERRGLPANTYSRDEVNTRAYARAKRFLDEQKPE